MGSTLIQRYKKISPVLHEDSQELSLWNRGLSFGGIHEIYASNIVEDVDRMLLIQSLVMHDERYLNTNQYILWFDCTHSLDGHKSWVQKARMFNVRFLRCDGILTLWEACNILLRVIPNLTVIIEDPLWQLEMDNNNDKTEPSSHPILEVMHALWRRMIRKRKAKKQEITTQKRVEILADQFYREAVTHWTQCCLRFRARVIVVHSSASY